jgi:hypothetical protein
MKIEINYAGNKYAINITDQSYDLVKYGTVTDKKSKNVGNETETNLGYFTSVGTALNALIRNAFAGSDEVLTIKEYAARIENAVESLKSFVDVKL